MPELLRQRIFAMAMGYEDLNDHDALRFDPVMTVDVGVGVRRRQRIGGLLNYYHREAA